MATGHYETCCGTVERVEHGTVYVTIAQPAVNEACRRCGACGGASAPRTPPRIRVPVSQSDIEPGQQVRLRRYVLNPALSAALVFGPPLTGALSGIVLAANLPGGGMDSPVSFLGGLFGALSGAFVGLIAEAHLSRTRPPSIV